MIHSQRHSLEHYLTHKFNGHAVKATQPFVMELCTEIRAALDEKLDLSNLLRALENGAGSMWVASNREYPMNPYAHGSLPRKRLHTILESFAADSSLQVLAPSSLIKNPGIQAMADDINLMEDAVAKNVAKENGVDSHAMSAAFSLLRHPDDNYGSEAIKLLPLAQRSIAFCTEQSLQYFAHRFGKLLLETSGIVQSHLRAFLQRPFDEAEEAYLFERADTKDNESWGTGTVNAFRMVPDDQRNDGRLRKLFAMGVLHELS